MPVAEGHLDTDTHREAAETLEWHCNDQKPQWQSKSGNLSLAGGHSLASNQMSSLRPQEMNAGKELPILLICVIQLGAETEQETTIRWCRNIVDFTSQTTTSATSGTIFCGEVKVVWLVRQQ